MDIETFGVLEPTIGIVVHVKSGFDPGDGHARAVCGGNWRLRKTRKAVGMDVNCEGCLRYLKMKEAR